MTDHEYIKQTIKKFPNDHEVKVFAQFLIDNPRRYTDETDTAIMESLCAVIEEELANG